MKSKKISFRTLVLQIVLLAGFSLLQGCATGRGPVSWLNWPFGEAQYEQYDPVVVPADELVDEPAILAPIELPAASDYSSAPYIAPIEDAQVYTVQKGETLSSIASRYGTTWKNLQSYNNLADPNKIFPGQELRIPSDLGSPAPVVRAPAPARKTSTSSKKISQGTSYVIQRGDSLAKIAKRCGLTVAELKAANGLTSDRIIAGKSLSIPRKGEVKAAAPKAKPASAPVVIDDLVPVVDDIVIPAQPAETFTPAPIEGIEPVETAAAPVYDHVLYPGETLEDVARQYGCSQQDIMLLNGITDSNEVKPGSKLLVPIPK